MTVGVGGSTPAQALERLRNMMDGAQPIGLASYRARIAAAQAWMGEHGIAAAYLHAGSNLRYFSGVQWHPSERLVGALLPAEGALEYLAPAFEEGTVRDFQVVDGAIHTWEEHQIPIACCSIAWRRSAWASAARSHCVRACRSACSSACANRRRAGTSSAPRR